MYKNKCKYIVATTGYWDTGKYGKVIKHMIREARKKISETKKGRKLSEEVRRRISEATPNVSGKAV